MESDTESNDSDTRPTCSTKTARVGIKRKHYNQKFKAEWCKLQEFSTWLKKDPKDEYKAICSICNSSLSAEISVLKRHCSSTKHEQKKKFLLSSTSKSSVQPTIESAFKKAPTTLDEKCKVAEIKLAAFIAEHKISHQVVDHLCDLISATFSEPEVAKKIQLKHTKAQAVINNVVGRSEKDTLARDLQNSKFSVMIDESTDIAVVKTMCVVVRYYDYNHGKVLSRFWDLIQLFEFNQKDYSANARHLFKLVIKSFEKYSVPLDNIVGFGADGCNTMMGCRNSVSSQFREKCPGITVLKCICHSLHLCASDASKKLPPGDTFVAALVAQ
ncbi:zinc finger MYM-type protein 6-like [Ostrinia nubilalis]|uniref:zinc finger MYM-type protein 6-like n=1 Tax=Ostrinia nubilalis TaxID=29057 RepID=UPI0030822E2A